MKICFIPVCGLALLGLLFASPRWAAAQDTNKGSTLQVHVNYSGSGTVDEKHKIYVVLWDSTAFIDGASRPVELEPLSSKDGTVTFSEVKKVPAYVSAAFDPNGQWDAKSGPPPPDGSSLGLYSTTPGKPAPVDIAPGKTASIDLSFDDSVKMRSGKASREAH